MKAVRRLIGIVLLCVLTVSACGKSLEKQITEQLELGRKYLAEQNYEEAIIAFNKVIELEPQNEAAYLGLADAYIENSQIDEAITILENIHETISGDDIDIKLSGLYAEKIKQASQNLLEASEYYESFLKMENSTETMYLELAEVYAEQGMFDEAINILEQGRKNCESDRIEKLLDDLKDLQKEQLLLTMNNEANDIWATAHGDFDNNGKYEMFAVVRGTVSEAERNADIYYLSDNETSRKILHIVMPVESKGIQLHCNNAFASFSFYKSVSDEQEVVTQYYIFDAVDEKPKLIYSEEGIEIPKENIFEEIDNQMERFEALDME